MSEKILKSLSIALLILIPSCVLKNPVNVMDGTKEAVILNQVTIKQDTVWRGDIVVNGLVHVSKGITLTVLPGARISFTYIDDDRDGIGDSGLLINGRLSAKGTPEKLILFTSKDRFEPASWGEIRIEDASFSELSYCKINYADWGGHFHFTPVNLIGCVIENCRGGTRFRSGPVEIRNCTIQNNEIGIRYLYSNPVIEGNLIKNNLTGIFIREGSKRPVIINNHLDNKDYNIKLGEGQEFDIDCSDNYWGTADMDLIEKKIYDKSDSNYLGMVIYEPIRIN